MSAKKQYPQGSPEDNSTIPLHHMKHTSLTLRAAWKGEGGGYSSRNTFDMGIKLCPCELNLVANILKSK